MERIVHGNGTGYAQEVLNLIDSKNPESVETNERLERCCYTEVKRMLPVKTQWPTVICSTTQGSCLQYVGMRGCLKAANEHLIELERQLAAALELEKTTEISNSVPK